MTKPFRILVTEATEKLAEAYKQEIIDNMHSPGTYKKADFTKGSALPNELLVMALETLDKCENILSNLNYNESAAEKEVLDLISTTTYDLRTKLEESSK